MQLMHAPIIPDLRQAWSNVARGCQVVFPGKGRVQGMPLHEECEERNDPPDL